MELKRAALYIRVSTDMQAEEGESIPAQRDRLARWARDNGYVVAGEYVDAGASARAADRPEFLRMMADAREKPRLWDAILVWKWDRFARNADDAVVYKQLLRRQLGLDLISVGDPRSEGAVGLLMERILDVVAEFQSLTTAEHVKNTMGFLAQQGRWLGKIPFGYRLDENGKLAIREDEAVAVRWAFDQVSRRQASVTSIAEDFAAAVRFPATAGRGYRWSYQAVAKMLRNRVYIGEVLWNRRFTEISNTNGTSHKRVGNRSESEWITSPDAHPAVVDRELFDAVQRILSDIGGRYSARSAYGDYLFRGMVRCAQCGGNMVLYAPDNGGKPKLACSAYFRVRSVACRPLNSIRLDELATSVGTALNTLAGGATPPDLEIVVDKPHTGRTPEVALAAVQQRLQRLLDAYEGGAITLDEFRERRGLLDAETARLEAAIQEHKVEALDSPRLVERLRRTAREILPIVLGDDSELTIPQQNAALTLAIDHITVDRAAGRIQIVWRVPREESSTFTD